jgi:hypothetical protein
LTVLEKGKPLKFSGISALARQNPVAACKDTAD